MTTPTQAQIEAAALAVRELLPTNLKVVSDQLAEAALTAAAQVGDDTISDLTTGGKPTAQVGEKFSAEKYRALPKYDAETIERCAQVADNFIDPRDAWANLPGKIAAAIRKLKDET